MRRSQGRASCLDKPWAGNGCGVHGGALSGFQPEFEHCEIELSGTEHEPAGRGLREVRCGRDLRGVSEQGEAATRVLAPLRLRLVAKASTQLIECSKQFADRGDNRRLESGDRIRELGACVEDPGWSQSRNATHCGATCCDSTRWNTTFCEKLLGTRLSSGGYMCMAGSLCCRSEKAIQWQQHEARPAAGEDS